MILSDNETKLDLLNNQAIAKTIVLMMTVLNVLLTFVNIIPNKKYLNYGVKEQFQDILPVTCPPKTKPIVSREKSW